MSNEIALLVRHWLARAEEDWDAVEMLTRFSDCPRNVVCFHCQQNVEKLLKALLTLHQIEFPKTHNLATLIELTATIQPDLSGIIDASDKLTRYAVETRYPDDFREISETEMEGAIETAKSFQTIIAPAVDSVERRQ